MRTAAITVTAEEYIHAYFTPHSITISMVTKAHTISIDKSKTVKEPMYRKTAASAAKTPQTAIFFVLFEVF